MQSEGQSRLRGSFIFWATYTNLLTRRNYSVLSIRTVTKAAMKSVCRKPSRATDGPAQFWDGVITSSSHVTRLRNETTVLRNRSLPN